MISLRRGSIGINRLIHSIQRLNHSAYDTQLNRSCVESAQSFSSKPADGLPPSAPLLPGLTIPLPPHLDPDPTTQIQSSQKDVADVSSFPLLFALPSPGFLPNDTVPSWKFGSPILSTPSQRVHAMVVAQQNICLCAVPKKKHTVAKRRIRRAGQRLAKRKWQYVQYYLCDTCGDPTRQHHLCMTCYRKKDGTVPHFDVQFGKTELEKEQEMKEDKKKLELTEDERNREAYYEHRVHERVQNRKGWFSLQNQRRQKAKRAIKIKKKLIRLRIKKPKRFNRPKKTRQTKWGW